MLRLSASVAASYGYRCQICDLSFKEKYGALGTDFIEVHHLVPLSTLELDEARTYSINDFFGLVLQLSQNDS